MITKLELTNFRGIKKGELELTPVTILLGANNSAKSTILESIFLAPNPCRNVPYVVSRLQKRVGSSVNSSYCIDVVSAMHETLDYTGYAFLLHNYTSDFAKISCQTKEKEHYLEFFTQKNYLYVASNNMTNKNRVQIGGEIKDFFASFQLNQRNPQNIYDEEPFIEETLLVSPKLIGPAYEYLRNQWPEVTNSRISRKVAEKASTLSPESYMDFTMEPFFGGKTDINAYLKDGKRIRMGDIGEGIQSYVISRMLYELVNPAVLLWDDIESHLNPRILYDLSEWFSELVAKQKQVIISTHSLEATRTIAGLNEETTSIYLTSLQNSILKTKKLLFSDLQDFEKAGIDPRTAEAFLL